MASKRRGLKTIGIATLVGVALFFLTGVALRLYYPFPFREYVQKHAQHHHIDPLLIVSVIRVESGFNPRAVSVKGARGLMQLMPDTATWVADQLNLPTFHTDALFEPETNVLMGTWYLSDLRRVFNNETILAIAAYNGGRGNVQRWLNEELWSGKLEEIDDIPFPETRAYVKKVISTYAMYRRIWGRSFRTELAL